MRRSVLSGVIVLLLAGTVIAPAGAEEDPTRKHPLKPGGQISSFEDPTLTIERSDGATWTGDVSCDVKVGIARKRVRSRGRGHINLVRGSTADLEPGAWVLRLKVEAGLIDKILIRKAPEVTTESGKTRVDKDALLPKEKPARDEARDDSADGNCGELDETDDADVDEPAGDDSATDDGDKTGADTDTKDAAEDRPEDEASQEPADDCPTRDLDESVCGTE